MSNSIRTLSNGDLVRLSGWNHVTFAKAGSVEGYASSNGDDPAPALARAQANGHALAWVSYAGGALVNDRGAYFAEQKRKAASAVTLEPGEVVQMEGRFYRVRVMARCEARPIYSDPIKLDPCEAPKAEPNPRADALAYETSRDESDDELAYESGDVMAACVDRALAEGWRFDLNAYGTGDWPWYVPQAQDDGRCVKRDGEWRFYVETAAEALAESGMLDQFRMVDCTKSSGNGAEIDGAADSWWPVEPGDHDASEGTMAPAIATEWKPDDASARYLPRMCSMRSWGAYDVELGRFHLDAQGRPVAFNLGVEAQALCDSLNGAPPMVPQVAQQQQARDARHTKGILEPGCIPERKPRTRAPQPSTQTPKRYRVNREKGCGRGLWDLQIARETGGGYISLMTGRIGESPASKLEHAEMVRDLNAAPALLAALRAVLPYAESRLEDMEAACEAAVGYIDEETHKARKALEAARQVIEHAKD